MRGVAVEFAGVVGDDMVRQVLVEAVVAERPVGEGFGPAHEETVIVHRVGVIHGQQQLAVETVHGAAIAVHAVEDVLPVEQLLEPGQRRSRAGHVRPRHK